MKNKHLSKRIILVVALAAVLVFAVALTIAASTDTSQFEMSTVEFSKRFNSGVSKLPSAYDQLKIFSITNTSRTDFKVNHAEDEHFIYSSNMTAQMRGITCYKDNITTLTLCMSPYAETAADSSEYAEQWTDTAVLMYTSLIRNMSEASARKILKDNLSMPIYENGSIVSVSDKEALAKGKTVRIKMNGLNIDFFGSMKADGDIKLSVKLRFETDSVVVVAPMNSGTPEPAPTVLVAEQTTKVKLGDKFKVDLEANSGKECKWSLSTSGTGKSILVRDEITSASGELIGEPAVSSKIDPPTLAEDICSTSAVKNPTGGLQRDYHTFLATRTGTQKLIFEYWHPENGKRIITKIVTFTVEIER